MNNDLPRIFAVRPWCALALGLLGLGLCLGATAGVDIKFVSPDQFIDAGESVMDRERMLPLLEAHLRALAARHVTGTQDILIEVREINLAGEIEPHGRTRERVRVMRTVTPPMMELHYTLSEAGTQLRQGDARLIDLAYQSRANRYPSGDSLRYEKLMLDEWFSSEFAAKARP